ELAGRLEAWTETRRAAGAIMLRHGVGIHTGEVLAASIGSPERLSYALVGDPVNLASRIQDLTKEVGAEVLVSGATVRRLKEPVALEALPAVRVKGRTAEVEVYRAACSESPGLRRVRNRGGLAKQHHPRGRGVRTRARHHGCRLAEVRGRLARPLSA